MEIFEVFVLLATFFAAGYAFVVYNFGYWSRKCVPTDSPVFPFGSVKGLGREANLGTILKNKYLESKNLPYYGLNMFLRPFLLLRDPNLIKDVLTKNFSTFHDRGFHFNTEREPLINHLFFLEGQKWRNMRIKLAPTFTSGKMKMMFPTMLQCSDELIEFLEEPVKNGKILEMKGVLAKFTMNIISRCAFGLNLNSFNNEDNELQRVSDFLFNPSAFQSFQSTILFAFAKYLYHVPLRIVPPDKSDYFIKMVTDVMKQREESGIHRNDFMQLLIELKNKGKIEGAEVYSHGDFVGETDSSEVSRNFTMVEAAAQAFVFFVAGFETASTTMQFTLFELIQNPEILEKLQKEIDDKISDTGLFTYEAIQSMTYLDQVVSETLRKYPTAPFLAREVRTPFKIPDSDVTLDPGTQVMISVLGLHHDPEYFPDPEKFNPERFSKENREQIIPFTYIPFGEGPRMCIGMRFGQLQVKLGLARFLSRYNVETCSETPTSPLKFNPKAILTVLKDGMPVKVTSRKKFNK